jgi:hypothetical protein
MSSSLCDIYIEKRYNAFAGHRYLMPITILKVKSDVYIICNRIGPKTEICGIPLYTKTGNNDMCIR